jgi:hypothetical protein
MEVVRCRPRFGVLAPLEPTLDSQDDSRKGSASVSPRKLKRVDNSLRVDDACLADNLQDSPPIHWLESVL